MKDRVRVLLSSEMNILGTSKNRFFILLCAEHATNRFFAQLFAVTALAGKKFTEPGADAPAPNVKLPQLPLRALFVL